METVFEQTLALWLEDKDEHRALESDTIGLNVKGNLYLSLCSKQSADHSGSSAKASLFHGALPVSIYGAPGPT